MSLFTALKSKHPVLHSNMAKELLILFRNDSGYTELYFNLRLEIGHFRISSDHIPTNSGWYLV